MFLVINIFLHLLFKNEIFWRVRGKAEEETGSLPMLVYAYSTKCQAHQVPNTVEK